MKVSYKNIRRKVSMGRGIVDYYYGMTLSDFFSDEDIREMELNRIKYCIMKGQGRLHEIFNFEGVCRF